MIIDFVDCWFGLDAAWQGIYAAYSIAGSIYAPDEIKNLTTLRRNRGHQLEIFSISSAA